MESRKHARVRAGAEVGSLGLAFVVLLELGAAAAGQGVCINGPLHPEGDVYHFGWSADGRRLVFSADPSSHPNPDRRAFEVFVAEMEGGPDASALRSLGPGYRFQLSHDGHWIVYDDVPDCPGLPFCIVSAGLFCAPLDGSRAPVELNQGMEGFAQEYAFDATSTRLVFLQSAHGRNYAFDGLFARPADGSAPPTSLNEPPAMLPGRYFTRFELAPDAARVVYGLDDPAFSGIALRSVPIDRSQEPVMLHAPLVHPQIVRQSFRITPDSHRVVFVADLERTGTFELFRAPLDGSAPPVRLGPPLPAQADVDAGFLLTPDGTRVVFVADLEQDEVFELWSMPLEPARGALPLRLSEKPVLGGDVALARRRPWAGLHDLAPQFDLAPDGRTLVYRADALVDERVELFRVPLDGSTPPLRVNQPLAAGQSVPAFGVRFLRAPERVVFAAPDELGALRPFVAALEGLPEASPLGGPFAAGGQLWVPGEDASFSLQLTPDGQQVVYLADQRHAGTLELFAAALDGERGARVLNARPVAGGGIRTLGTPPEFPLFAISPDGRWVAYTADQRTDEQIELFVSALRQPRLRPAAAPRPLF